MKSLSASLSVLLLATLAGGAHAKVLRPGADRNEVALDFHEVKTLMRSQTSKHYRVCLDSAAHNEPIKIVEDNDDIVVKPGDCADYQGTRLRVTPANRLPSGSELVLHYHHEP